MVHKIVAKVLNIESTEKCPDAEVLVCGPKIYVRDLGPVD